MKKRTKRRQKPKNLPSGMKTRYAKLGELKMSEVLDEFVDPFKTAGMSDDGLRELYAMGAFAWNFSFEPESNRRKAFEEAAKDTGIPPMEWDSMWTVLEFMIQHKLEFFGSINRFIYDFQMTADSDTINLQVLSTERLPKLGK